MPEARFAKANRINIRYLDWGGDGPPAVLAHGTSLCAEVWSPIAAAMSHRYHVLAVDHRGHGDTDKVGPFDFETIGRDLVAFSDALGLERALAVGHSAGGTASIVWAAERPGAVARMVLIEPTILAVPPGRTLRQEGRNPMADRARRRRNLWPSREETFRSWHGRESLKLWRDDILWAYVEGGTRPTGDGRFTLKCPPDIEAQFYLNSAKLDPWPYIGRVRCPVLMIMGGASNAAQNSPLTIGKFQELVPNARLASVPGGTHFVPMEQPEAIARLILGFGG